jgi:hypothetical protein
MQAPTAEKPVALPPAGGGRQVMNRVERCLFELWGALRALRAKQAFEDELEDADDEDTKAEQEGEYCVCLESEAARCAAKHQDEHRAVRCRALEC